MTNSKINLALGISTTLLLVSGAMTVVLSNDVAADNLSPGQIFQKAQDTYAALTNYSDEGHIIATMNDTTITTAFTIRLARTNFYRVEWEQTVESTYSTNHTEAQAVWSSGSGNFLEMGHGPQNEDSRDIALAKATEVSGGAAGTIPRTFFNMQWGDQLGGSGLNQNQQADEKVGDVDCYVFTRESQGRTKTLWIGKQDFLIHQIRTVTSAEAMQAMLAKAKVDPELIALLQTGYPHGVTSTETHTGVVVNNQLLRSDFIPTNGE